MTYVLVCVRREYVPRGKGEPEPYPRGSVNPERDAIMFLARGEDLRRIDGEDEKCNKTVQLHCVRGGMANA